MDQAAKTTLHGLGEPVEEEFAGPAGPRLADRRTRICAWIIVLGLANFVGYSVGYWLVGGDAMNGYVTAQAQPAGPAVRHYWIGSGATDLAVSRGVWIYSAVHSTSVLLTMGAVLLAMLTLAKDRVTSSLRSSVVRGRAVITILAAIIVLATLGLTAYFLQYTIGQLLSPAVLQSLP